MRKYVVVFVTVLAMGFQGIAYAAPVVVKNLRLWRAPDHTRVVFDLSNKVEHRLSELKNPDRLVIDLDDAILGTLPSIDYGDSVLKDVRSGNPKPGILRIVLDLKQQVKPRTFVLKPNQLYGHRLVVDLYDRKTTSTQVSRVTADKPPSHYVIAIDAGHGGEDPGAIGRHGTREKWVTQKVAEELRKLVQKDPAMQAAMVRRGDYYIGLRQRTKVARDRQADLFVSIHADAFPNRSVRGSSVYALSQRGASSEEAKWLASRENAADLIGGVSLRDKDDLVAQVLLDLSMTNTVNESLILASDVLRQLRRIGVVHKKKVEQAGFAVLKSPDMPSILVETAFITNPNEEKLLRDAGHRRKIARAIYTGIRNYLLRKPRTLVRGNAVSGTGPTIHIVRRGDSLSKIAQRYQVSIGALKKANKLRGDVVRIGQKIRIPTG